ncbi:MAG: NAD-dependent epimerase/dehydratase family protein [Mobilicoccus sp.]|nr:NAD-dependent epimerase/dehydratase family protein [Mobilicoccus sp.]
MAATVLVTGVSTYLGACVAADLAARDDVERVVGVDVRPPARALGAAEFLRADVRNPLLRRVIAGVDTVVHFGAVPVTGSRSARVSAKETAVIGTMHLVGVCQAQRDLRHVVLVSTGSVYGASASAPAIVTEDHGVQSAPRAGHVQEAIEVESYVQALGRRRPDVGVSILRLTHVFGGHTRSAMSNYLRAPVVPVPFGFDARMQALGEEDAVGAIVAAAAGEPVGIVNVAGQGVITVRQALRIARRPTVPVFTTTGRAVGTVSRWAGIPGVDADHMDYIMYGRCLDTTRMREVLGFTPRLSTRAAFEAFARQVWGTPAPPSTTGGAQ